MKKDLLFTFPKTIFLFFLILVFAPKAILAQEEINVVGNIQSIVDGDISPSLLDRTDFEFAIVGGGTKIRTFTIENSGTQDLIITAITGTGDFASIGALTPSSPIPAGDNATFTVTFSPLTVGLQTGTITIENSDLDEGTYDFAVQGTGASSAIGTWDPLLYPPSSCSWTSQDNNATNSPYASWNLVVQETEAAGINKVITLQPDAYVGSYDYDNTNGNESCLGHQVATTLDANAAQNGLQILGSTGGCLTFIDLSSGSGSDQWANFSGMNGLTIKNIYLRQWGGGMNFNTCTNVLIEDCVIENCNNAATEAVLLTGCTNVIFRRCKFLGNVNPAGRAIRVDNSGTAGNRILFEDCDFGCNSSNSEGAALMVGAGSFVQVTRGVFSGNQATNSGKGGAVNIAVGGDVVFDEVDFIDNTASSSISTEGGGAIYVNGNSNTTQTTVFINACHFYENTTGSSGRGGAIVCQGNSTNVSRSNTTIQNSIFERNGADRGGAVLAFNATVLIHNNFFTENQNAALSGNNERGGGLFFQNAAGNYTITNNTFVNNLSSSGQVGRNATACGGCFSAITNNNYGTQSHVSLANSGGTTGWSLTPSSLATAAANYDCSTGAYCAFTLSGSCLSNTQSDYICSPTIANSATISGQVWDDANGNGIQEVSDLGISNVFVLLYDESGNLVGRTNTDGDGDYAFTNLLPGNYRVVYINPDIAAYPFVSPANASGSSEPTDSDQDFTTVIGTELRGATSANVELTAGANVTDVDLGLTNIDLPIELAFFNAKKVQNKTVLNWSTQSELDNDYFSIQRSKDGIHWEKIGRVRGKGTTAEIQYYSTEDQLPYQGINYYQLTQFDFDGTYSHSPIVAVDHNTLAHATLFPNPTRDYIHLHTTSSHLDAIWVTDITGKTLAVPYYKTGNSVRIDVQHLDAGLYYLHYESNNHTQQQKFVKQ